MFLWILWYSSNVSTVTHQLKNCDLNYMIQNDINKFIEIGPGKVLTGLVKKIDRNVNIESINSVSEVESYKIWWLILRTKKY